MLLEQREFFCVCVCLALPFVLQKVTVAEVWLLIRNGTKSDGLCSVFGGWTNYKVVWDKLILLCQTNEMDFC